MKHLRISHDRLDVAVLLALVAMALAILAVQARSLLLAPVFDSYLWWGDESWLMLEFRQQLLTGKFVHPFALGSSIHIDNGFLLSNMWITAAIYGGAGFLGFPLVSTGRVVTFVLGIVLLASVFLILRRTLRIELHWALFGVLALASTRIFFLTSHSVRYDILSAILILWSLVGLKRVQDSGASTSLPLVFVLGAGFGLSLLISVHVPLLLSLPLIFVLLHLRAHRDLRKAASFIAGIATGVGLLVVVYYALYGHWGLFGPSRFSSHESNFWSIPLLRPLSRSVQVANLLQKVQHLSRFAPLVALLAIIGIVPLVSRWKTVDLSKRRFIVLLVLCFLSWLFLESAAPPSYTLYPGLLLTLILTIGAAQLNVRRGPQLALTLVAALWFARTALADGLDALLVARTLNNSQTEIFNEAISHLEHKRPRVLVQAPFMTRALESKRIVPMTTSFIDYPEHSRSTIATLRQQDVRYLLLINSPLNQQYMREVAPLKNVAERYGTVLYRRTAPVTDIMRDYFAPDLSQADTVTLYKLNR